MNYHKQNIVKELNYLLRNCKTIYIYIYRNEVEKTLSSFTTVTSKVKDNIKNIDGYITKYTWNDIEVKGMTERLDKIVVYFILLLYFIIRKE